ncbi:MAG: TRAP transporter small permease subunit [Alphaproteobacteria bacterium]|nr:TRAP transporter small permease subunit [Alphaproteobacteria bacterium]
MRAWKAIDAVIVRSTEFASVAIGLILLTFLSLGIVGRYITGFSVSFVESASRLLLVWFFLLGCGLALRVKAHVGMDMLQRKLSPPAAKAVIYLAHIGSLVFYAMVLAGTQQALDISASTTEPSLGISGLWGMISVPIGFALLVYHQVYLMIDDWLRPDAAPEQQQLTE